MSCLAQPIPERLIDRIRKKVAHNLSTYLGPTGYGTRQPSTASGGTLSGQQVASVVKRLRRRPTPPGRFRAIRTAPDESLYEKTADTTPSSNPAPVVSNVGPGEQVLSTPVANQVNKTARATSEHVGAGRKPLLSDDTPEPLEGDVDHQLRATTRRPPGKKAAARRPSGKKAATRRPSEKKAGPLSDASDSEIDTQENAGGPKRKRTFSTRQSQL